MVDNSSAATARFGVRPNLPNVAPVLAPLADVPFLHGQSVTITVSATDADDTMLTFRAGGLPAGIIIDPSTGLINGELAATAVGSYLVTVTDPQGASAQRSFTLAVMAPTNIGDEEEPVLSERIYLPLVAR